ncbi:cysteine dioxygenase family protein [Allopusillimonas ginsengisoli]|uniref:cysteine dioxygenase family protein n=1 Tax=Allopusillimonas ginsengisoli TaxID=453575 RepID=UPI001021F45A|nr:cysteine dioxygenase family protein [Allopusillimonas ginsengisoli]TEA79177.1 cysteine dioxygenase [Allopusillimonas ginsengisoli]
MEQKLEEDNRLEKQIDGLVVDIENACLGPAAQLPEAISTALSKVPADTVAALSARAPSQDAYTRRLLHADVKGRFSVVALTWLQGQCTPVHAHYTWCAYRVVQGALQEEQYIYESASQNARLAGVISRHVGDTAYGHGGFDQIHKLGNVGAETAVSLHVYGIDGQRVATHVNRLI